MNNAGKKLLSKTKSIRTLWGLDLNFKDTKVLFQQLKSIKQTFDGIEVATGFFDPNHKSEFIKICKDLNLSIITQIHTNGYPIKSADMDVHLEDFKSKLEDSLTWDPILINSHSGTDYWRLEKNIEFFKNADEITNKIIKSKIEVCHETHRQRILFNPFVTFEILKIVPNIKLTLDLSHWILTSERLLSEDSEFYWKELQNIFIKNTGLIHGRIGTVNSIQVVDPEYFDNYEKYFYSIWKNIIEHSNRKEIYIDYEYGPEPYLFVNPITGTPFKNLGDVINEQKIKFEKYLRT